MKNRTLCYDGNNWQTVTYIIRGDEKSIRARELKLEAVWIVGAQMTGSLDTLGVSYIMAWRCINNFDYGAT